MSKKILLIITGSVAAYKAVELARMLQKKDYDVSCILTKAAQEFVTPLLVSSVMKHKVYTELFSSDDVDGMTHIKLSRDNDLIVVAPASADFMAKIANGYADDLASTVILAANKPIMIAPAMNEKMWYNQATQKNLRTLVESGISMVEPITDVLACGETGIGKMQEPEIIAQEVEEFFALQNKLRDKKILLTGGGTREMIDPVRFIGNDSSGKQAIALTRILKAMGADITFVAANINLSIPLDSQKIIRVRTADEMFAVVKNELASNSVFIGCAAVSDYKVKNPSTQKIKKDQNDECQLYLTKTIDILDYVGHAPNRPALVIGFAAESNNLVKYAQEKLQKKNCDFIIANDVNDGKIFGAEASKAYIIGHKGIVDLGEINKMALAKIIAREIVAALK